MTDQREAHKFDPVGRGLCSVCNLPKNVLQHKRWAEKEYEEALMAEQALLNLDGGWSQEEEDRRIEKANEKVRIGDTVYWLDQHVRRQSKGAGVCAEELPWVAMPVKGKIGYLKNRARPGGWGIFGLLRDHKHPQR